jgi:hypothetical protein
MRRQATNRKTTHQGRIPRTLAEEHRTLAEEGPVGTAGEEEPVGTGEGEHRNLAEEGLVGTAGEEPVGTGEGEHRTLAEEGPADTAAVGEHRQEQWPAHLVRARKAEELQGRTTAKRRREGVG